MSFWSTVGNIAGKVGSYALEEAKAATNRSKEYNAEMPSKSDDELLAIISKELTRSPLKSGAASKELKSRGYSSEDIKVNLRRIKCLVVTVEQVITRLETAQMLGVVLNVGNLDIMLKPALR